MSMLVRAHTIQVAPWLVVAMQWAIRRDDHPAERRAAVAEAAAVAVPMEAAEAAHPEPAVRAAAMAASTAGSAAVDSAADDAAAVRRAGADISRSAARPDVRVEPLGASVAVAAATVGRFASPTQRGRVAPRRALEHRRHRGGARGHG